MPTKGPDPTARPQSSDLIRGLGVWSAVAIVIGDTIGTGIFLVSSDMARAAGSTPLVFAAWLIGGLIVLFGAFCYAELGAAFLSADLGLTPEPREDHAAYIGNWLNVLKNDKRAIFTAASHAQRAADLLHSLQQPAAKADAA